MADLRDTVVQEAREREIRPKEYSITQPTPCRPDRIVAVGARVAETHPAIIDFRDRLARVDEPAVAAILRRIAAWPANEVRVRAYEVPGSMMDRLLRVFVVQTDPALRDRIDAILQARMKRRFCSLVWQLLQDRCADAALLSLLFSGAVGRPSFRTGDRLRFLEFFKPEDRTPDLQAPDDRVSGRSLPERVYLGLKAAQMPIDAFFADCEIPPEAGLAIEVLALYFAACDKSGFIREAASFKRLTAVLSRPLGSPEEEARLAGFFAPPLGAYLMQLDPPDYDGDRLRDVVPRFGLPHPSNPLWSHLDDAHRMRFNQWLHLDRMRDGLKDRRQKIRILAGLYQYIENINIVEEAGLMFIHFSKFVLVDRKEEPDVMLLYPRKVFAESYDLYMRLRAAREEAIRRAEEMKNEPAEPEIVSPLETQDDESSSESLDSDDAFAEMEVDTDEPVGEAVGQESEEAPQSPEPQVPAAPQAVSEPLDSVVPWPVNPEAVTMARIAILETRTERDRRQTLAQSILRGTSDRIVHMRFEDTPILYARQFLYDLLG